MKQAGLFIRHPSESNGQVIPLFQPDGMLRINLTLELSEEQVANLIAARESAEGTYSITVKASSIFAPPRQAELLQPRWLSINDAKRYVGLSDTQLRKACARGLVKSRFARMPGQGAGKRLIERVSLDEWIEAGDPGRQAVIDDVNEAERKKEARRDFNERWGRTGRKQ